MGETYVVGSLLQAAGNDIVEMLDRGSRLPSKESSCRPIDDRNITSIRNQKQREWLESRL